MKLGEYLASKAVTLCFTAIAVVIWLIFAFLSGAEPLLIWVSVGFFVPAVIFRYLIGFAFAKKRLNKVRRIKENLSEKFLLGELLPVPLDAVEREYFLIMKEVSSAAIGEVEASRREKEEYFDSVEKWVHEIKTPLTACSLICDNGGDPVKLRRQLKRAENCTDTILQYARLRSPQHDTAITKVSASDIIDRAIRSQRELLVAAKIGITTEGDFTTYTDPKAVCFMLKQLLINCAKYCGGCRIGITAKEGKITVADDGPGIVSYDLPRIFERGFTGQNAKGGGTGMGLYIVSEMCKRLTIELSVDSEENAGTRFGFKFSQHAPV